MKKAATAFLIFLTFITFAVIIDAVPSDMGLWIVEQRGMRISFRLVDRNLDMSPVIAKALSCGAAKGGVVCCFSRGGRLGISKVDITGLRLMRVYSWDVENCSLLYSGGYIALAWDFKGLSRVMITDSLGNEVRLETFPLAGKPLGIVCLNKRFYFAFENMYVEAAVDVGEIQSVRMRNIAGILKCAGKVLLVFRNGSAYFTEDGRFVGEDIQKGVFECEGKIVGVSESGVWIDGKKVYDLMGLEGGRCGQGEILVWSKRMLYRLKLEEGTAE